MKDDLALLMEEVEELPVFESPRDFMRHGRIPYKVFRDLETPAGGLVDEENPAMYRITPDTGGGQSLSIWVWEGVPVDFCNTLFYHELKESEFRFADGFSREESHERAVPLHMAYAKKFLSEDKFHQFLEWQSQYDAYSDESFFGR